MATSLRGTCDGMPLELTGEFTGYNNGATMQVGLWITNDGEHIGWARSQALSGPAHLRRELCRLLRDSQEPHIVLTFYAAMNASGGGFESIDWAQICFQLVFIEPNALQLLLTEQKMQFETGDWPRPGAVWAQACRQNEAAAAELAMRGVDG